MRYAWLQLLLRLVLAGVFFWTAGLKIHGPNTGTLFGVLQRDHAWLAALVIELEVLLATWLLIGWRPRLAAYATAALLCVFSVQLAVEITRLDPKSCGCARLVDPDSEARKTPEQIRRELAMGLGRNVLLITAALLVAHRPRRSASPTSPADVTSEAPAAADQIPV